MFFNYMDRRYNAAFIVSISLRVEELKQFGEIELLDVKRDKNRIPVIGFSIVFPNFKLDVKTTGYRKSLVEYKSEVKYIEELHEALIIYTNYN